MQMGEDVFIAENAIIKRPELVKIGSHVAIDYGVIVSTKLTVGDYVHISPYVVMIGSAKSNVVIDDFAGVGAGTKIVAGSDNFDGDGLVGPAVPLELRKVVFTTVRFDKFAVCGVNCSIMPGVTLHEGAALGAHSQLTTDAEPWTIYLGSPARPVKRRRRDICIENARKLGYTYED